jgi:hypothetical protein
MTNLSARFNDLLWLLFGAKATPRQPTHFRIVAKPLGHMAYARK